MEFPCSPFSVELEFLVGTGKGVIFKNAGLEHFEHMNFGLQLPGSFKGEMNPLVRWNIPILQWQRVIRALTFIYISTHDQVPALHLTRSFLKVVFATPPYVVFGGGHWMLCFPLTLFLPRQETKIGCLMFFHFGEWEDRLICYRYFFFVCHVPPSIDWSGRGNTASLPHTLYGLSWGFP